MSKTGKHAAPKPAHKNAIHKKTLLAIVGLTMVLTPVAPAAAATLDQDLSKQIPAIALAKNDGTVRSQDTLSSSEKDELLISTTIEVPADADWDLGSRPEVSSTPPPPPPPPPSADVSSASTRQQQAPLVASSTRSQDSVTSATRPVNASVSPAAPATVSQAPVAPSGTASAPQTPSKPAAEASKPSSAKPSGVRARIVSIARQYSGTPYVAGGADPSGWDCSGFTSYVFAQAGIHLPRSSGEQRNAGREVSASEAQPGDLVWWTGHVGIYTGNGNHIAARNPSTGTFEGPVYGSPVYIRVL